MDSISNWIYNLLRPQRSEEWYKRAELYTNLNAYIIQLPYSLSELSDLGKGRLEKIKGHIDKICSDNNIEACVFSSSLATLPGFNECNKKLFDGKRLYKSLLINMMDKIYSHKGIKINDLDITIIQGKSREELLEVIIQLSPMVKYITILSGDKDGLQKEMEALYEDTGLSVRVTDNIKSSMRNADLVINLSDSCSITSGCSIAPKTVVLNFGNFNTTKILGEFTVINGVEISLPNDICSRLDSNIYEYFNKLEIAEIILMHRISSSEKGKENQCDYRYMSKVSKNFKEDGYKIVRFTGRHSTFRADEIAI
ncbi:MAG: hypothetical protein N3B21_16920 [Clostridia bacterium]|nr:hypothetical protein [Clostridia bacterium]